VRPSDSFNPFAFLNTGRTTKFAPVKSLWFSELLLGILLSKVRLPCSFLWAVEWIHESPPFSFFRPRKEKPPKEAWGGHLSGWGINVTFLHPHEPQLSAMRCVTLNQIDPSYMIFIRSFMVLFPHYSTLSSPLPIRCDKISRKQQVLRSFALIGFVRKMFEV